MSEEEQLKQFLRSPAALFFAIAALVASIAYVLNSVASEKGVAVSALIVAVVLITAVSVSVYLLTRVLFRKIE